MFQGISLGAFVAVHDGHQSLKASVVTADVGLAEMMELQYGSADFTGVSKGHPEGLGESSKVVKLRQPLARWRSIVAWVSPFRNPNG